MTNPIFEIAELRIDPASAAAFEVAVARAVPLFKNAPGCLGMALQRSIEHPDSYRLVVRWESVEAHTVGFRNSDAFAQWRALAGPFFASPPDVQHVEQVLTGF